MLFCKSKSSYSHLLALARVPRAGIKTLFSLLDNVLKNPGDASKRSINLGNDKFRERCGRFPAAVAYLKVSIKEFLSRMW